MEGPDQILSPTNDKSPLMTWAPDGAVRLRETTDGITPLSVPSMLRNAAEKYPDYPAMSVKRNDEYVTWNYETYYKEARSVGKAFIKLGLRRYHSVGILGFNSPEWTMSLVGAILAGGFGAGIYATNSPEACKYILTDSRADIVVVEDDKQLKKILSIRDQLPEIKAIVQYTGEVNDEEPDVYSWTELMEMGNSQDDSELEERLKNIAINQCCSLIYTSGTTGPPKGVMLSHDNVTWTARMSNQYLDFNETDNGISFLPLSHSAAQMMDIWMPIAGAMKITYCDKNALKGTLANTLKDARPTYFFGVPRVWEKIQEKMMIMGKSQSGLLKAVGAWAKRTGLQHNLKAMEGQNSNGGISYPIAKKLVFEKVRQNLGLDRAKCCAVGAAPISKFTLEYFLSLNIPIYECYGMSESSGPQTGNRPGSHRFQSIGKNVGGCVTRIQDPDDKGDGEVLMNSRNVMMGYLGNENQTLEAIDSEGWLHSGDIGRVDADGFHKITGRIKELIITAGGENVPPILIEDAVKQELPCVSNAMLIGDHKKFLSVLLTLKTHVNADTLEPKSELTDDVKEWCQNYGGTKVQTVQDFLKEKSLQNAIQMGIDKVNSKSTSNAQKIQKFVILPSDFSVPGGELGPTLKLKRHFVLKKYATQINNFYNC